MAVDQSDHNLVAEPNMNNSSNPIADEASVPQMMEPNPVNTISPNPDSSLSGSSRLDSYPNSPRHPSVYEPVNIERNFYRALLDGPVQVTPLNNEQMSIQEKKLANLANPIFFDDAGSKAEFLSFVYLRTDGVIIQIVYSISDHLIVDTRQLGYPFSLTATTAIPPPDVQRLPPSCRFLKGGHVVYNSGTGIFSIYTIECADTKWEHQMSFYIGAKSDNITTLLDGVNKLRNFYGWPSVIVDARMNEVGMEILLVGVRKRTLAELRKDPKLSPTLVKTFWITFAEPPSNNAEWKLRILRTRIFESDGLVDLVAFDQITMDELVIAGSCDTKIIYDSDNIITLPEIRPLVTISDIPRRYTWTQTETTIVGTAKLDILIESKDFTISFAADNVRLIAVKRIILEGTTFAKLNPFQCSFEIKHVLKEDREIGAPVETILIFTMTKAEPGYWDYIVERSELYGDELPIDGTSNSDPPYYTENAGICYVNGDNGILTFKEDIGKLIGISQPVPDVICAANKGDGVLYKFAEDPHNILVQKTGTLEHYADIMATIPDRVWTAFAGDGSYFVHINTQNVISLYSWYRTSERISEDGMQVIGQTQDLEFNAMYDPDAAEDVVDIIAVFPFDELLVVFTRTAMLVTTDVK